ncbi:MAG: NAD-dependent succinate-semialdehyde dehydrogenase [Candidatus Lustribacter sp.]|jgi:succinate-semialdehyde dehydrogenase/glutarate-semialdehyde dehydrogenase
MIAAQPKTVDSINPATGAKLESFALHTPAELDTTLDRAVAAQREWARRSFAERAVLMKRAGAYLRANKARFALNATREMGKPIGDAEAEVDKCAWACDFYADHAEGFLADEHIASTASESYIAYQPLGVVLAVMPWNFPYWQVFRFAAPALMAGNAGVLKHASNVTRCALDIEETFRESGFPAGAFSTVIVPGSEVKHLIADDRIAAVTITGSEPAGVSVASESGRALKKHVLELGGSDAFIVLADADLAAAAKTAAKARFQNAGQSCICGKRFIVEDAIYDRFVAAFIEESKAYRTGDPEDRATTMGPLARADLRDDLVKQIDGSVAMGARVVLGGTAPQGPGAYFEATVLVDVDDTMPVFREETFGPVAAVIRARDAAHAVEMANDSTFGLGGALWTRDVERAKHLARQIQTGAVFINGMTASDPRLPFGGIKHSGYGRELSYLGIREFMNIQTVWVGPAK